MDLEVTRGDIAVYREVLMHDPCAYCDAPSVVLDHIEPQLRVAILRSPDYGRRRRPNNQWSNVAGVCKSCNSAKGPRSLLGFLANRRWRPVYDELAEQRSLFAAVGLPQ